MTLEEFKNHPSGAVITATVYDLQLSDEAHESLLERLLRAGYLAYCSGYHNCSSVYQTAQYQVMVDCKVPRIEDLL